MMSLEITKVNQEKKREVTCMQGNFETPQNRNIPSRRRLIIKRVPNQNILLYNVRIISYLVRNHLNKFRELSIKESVGPQDEGV